MPLSALSRRAAVALAALAPFAPAAEAKKKNKKRKVVCRTVGQPCGAGNGTCCCGLNCRAFASLEAFCCLAAGIECEIGDDCCSLLCSGGYCLCKGNGQDCDFDADCCSFHCDGANKCAAPE
jgi:hypothetical protein